MKYALALILLCSQFTSFSQQNRLTLYAYEQKVSPGIAPARDVDEKGKVINKTSQAKTQYYIYLSSPRNINVYPVSIWIKGKLFAVNVDEATAPIRQLSASDSTIVLVPETEQKVLRLFAIKNTTPGKQDRKGATLARQNELVLVYQLKGKFHYMTKERFEQLDAMNMQ